MPRKQTLERLIFDEIETKITLLFSLFIIFIFLGLLVNDFNQSFAFVKSIYNLIKALSVLGGLLFLLTIIGLINKYCRFN